MRHEMSLALLITLMAALAAAESPPGGAAEATVVPGGPATDVATPRAGGHPEAYENKPGFREFCAAPRVVGPCRASFLRWYFDLESQTCKRFIFGGCRGNKNNYFLEEDCLSQCTGDGAVVLAVLLAILMTILLGSMGVFFVKICRKNPDLSVGTVWSTLDDKEYLMSNAYTL